MVTSKKQTCWFIQPGKMREVCNLVEFKNGGEMLLLKDSGDARTSDNKSLIKKNLTGKELGNF